MSGRSFMLTKNLETIRGGSTVLHVKQDAEEWRDVSAFGDLTFYIDVSEVTPPSGGSVGLVLLYLETSPTLDDSLFTPAVGPIPLGTTSTPLIVQSCSAAGAPLGRYLRWHIVSTIGATWDVTLRVRVVGNRNPYFAPAQLGNCTLWLRADRGLTLGAASPAAITAWADQSPTNDPNRNLTAGSTLPALTLVDSQYNNQMTVSYNGTANCYFANAGTWNPSVSTPKTWVLVGHRSTTSGTNYFMDGNSTLAGDAVWDTSTGVITCHSGSPLTSGAGNAWTAPSAMLFESNGSTSACYLNNWTTALMTGNAGSNTINTISLGVHSLAFGGGSNWIGSMAEVVCFSGLLTPNQKALLKRYVSSRYAISLS